MVPSPLPAPVPDPAPDEPVDGRLGGGQQLLDVAAQLLGVQTVDLLHVVRRADGSLVVILATGQKYVFDPSQIAAQLGADLETWVRVQLAPKQPAPHAAPAAPNQRADSPPSVLRGWVSPAAKAPPPATRTPANPSGGMSPRRGAGEKPKA